jgi:hypothetical protein
MAVPENWVSSRVMVRAAHKVRLKPDTTEV